MTKQEALSIIRRAKAAHIRWRAFALAKLAGLPVEQDQAPVHPRECAFGLWFYTEGFRTFAHWPIYQDLEYVHELLHAVYERIFLACEEGRRDDANRISAQLLGLSESMLATLNLLDEEALTSPDDAI